MTELYGEDLAQIHVEGYGFHWEGAAPSLLEWLEDAKVTGGVVVDLGCGGGQWLAKLHDEGYQTCGVDVSPHMIELAKSRAPKADYLCGSFADVELPECDAATSLGEPLNYLGSATLMKRTFRNVYKSLRENGMFIFDVRHPPLKQVEPVNHSGAGDDWFCHARIEEDENWLIRDITTFRRVSATHFRRDREMHRLKLFASEKIQQWLRAVGFRVRVRRAYGDYSLGRRQSAFICRKEK